jgi:putative hydrolase of the HAD superfamily
MIPVIAFDADDTLWHNEHFYSNTKQKFIDLLSNYKNNDHVSDILDELEVENIRYYGYGIKSFALSMIEAAIQMTNGEVRGEDIDKIIGFSKEMMDEELQLLDGVQETLDALYSNYPLMMITKGDLFEQHQKIARSGIDHFFDVIEVVADKNIEVYRSLLKTHKINPSEFLMIGNSLRSDIHPVVRLGAKAVYVPYQNTWSHENQLEETLDQDDYYVVEQINQVVDLINSMNFKTGKKGAYG